MSKLAQELTQSISADGGNIVEIPRRAHAQASRPRCPPDANWLTGAVGTLPGALVALAVTMGTVLLAGCTVWKFTQNASPHTVTHLTSPQ